MSESLKTEFKPRVIDPDEFPPEITHERTEQPHIWKVIKTGKFVYEDEANIFDDTEYNTIGEAYIALCNYCKHVLGD